MQVISFGVALPCSKSAYFMVRHVIVINKSLHCFGANFLALRTKNWLPSIQFNFYWLILELCKRDSNKIALCTYYWRSVIFSMLGMWTIQYVQAKQFACHLCTHHLIFSSHFDWFSSLRKRYFGVINKDVKLIVGVFDLMFW